MSEGEEVKVPQADSVRWMGLCPCGCGTYRAVLMDDDRPVITFGFDRKGWVEFIVGVLTKIKGQLENEPDEPHEHRH
jgi:hypothetical protein